jgi:hypothetical protein
MGDNEFLIAQINCVLSFYGRKETYRIKKSSLSRSDQSATGKDSTPSLRP